MNLERQEMYITYLIQAFCFPDEQELNQVLFSQTNKLVSYLLSNNFYEHFTLHTVVAAFWIVFKYHNEDVIEAREFTYWEPLINSKRVVSREAEILKHINFNLLKILNDERGMSEALV